jgi:hypothetical protein
MPSAAELSGLQPQSLRIPSHDGAMLNVGYLNKPEDALLTDHEIARPLQNISAGKRLNGAPDERVQRGPLHRDTKDF